MKKGVKIVLIVVCVIGIAFGIIFGIQYFKEFACERHCTCAPSVCNSEGICTDDCGGGICYECCSIRKLFDKDYSMDSCNRGSISPIFTIASILKTFIIGLWIIACIVVFVCIYRKHKGENGLWTRILKRNGIITAIALIVWFIVAFVLWVITRNMAWLE